MATFNGSLNTNEWFNSLYNAYLLVTTLSDNLKGLDNGLASRFKADADLYHDKFVWSDTDVLKTRAFDVTDANVLSPEDKGTVAQQEIVVDQARQIGFTAGNWLAKRAWQDAGSYDQFESVLAGQIGETRKLYEYQMVNTAVGTMKSSAAQANAGAFGSQNLQITLFNRTGAADITGTGTTDESTPVVTTYDLEYAGSPVYESNARLNAMVIANYLADLFVDMKDPGKNYNDNGFYKSFDPSDLLVIWNPKYKNYIMKQALPTVFNEAGLKADFEGTIIPSRYFGTVNPATVTTSTPVGTEVIRALEEMDVTPSGGTKTHIRPGEVVPSGVTLVDDGEIIVPTYTEDPKVICKIVHKDGVKYLSTLETSTEFFNAKNLTRNRYLTFAYAKPEYLAGRPMITIKEA